MATREPPVPLSEALRRWRRGSPELCKMLDMDFQEHYFPYAWCIMAQGVAEVAIE
jgi:hypothetical protein